MFLKKTVFWAIAIMFIFTSCIFPDNEDDSLELPIDWDESYFLTLEQYLLEHPAGECPDDPIDLSVRMNLGDMTAVNSGWHRLLESIGAVGKYVALDLSDSILYGTEFVPYHWAFDALWTFDVNKSKGSKKIVSLVLPNTAKIIAGFESIVFPPGWETYVGILPFYNLRYVKGEYVDTIRARAFAGISSLRSVNFPRVTTIGIAAFAETGLTKAYFPLVTYIGRAAFGLSTALESVSFPSAKYIGENAFWGCTALESVRFPSAEYIGGEAFFGCTALESVYFPSAKYIGESAFFGCTALESVSFPSAKYIGHGAFGDCTALETIRFPANATIKRGPFVGNILLIYFDLIGEGYLRTIENGRALVRNNVELISYPTASGKLVMNEVTSIGEFAFANTSLENVSFPMVTHIGSAAFSGNTVLKSVNFPMVTHIGSTAFNGTALESVSFPMVMHIGSGAFNGNAALTTIRMGNFAPTVETSVLGSSWNLPNINITVSVPVTAVGFGSSPEDASTNNWGNAFRGRGWDGTNFLNGRVDNNVTLHIVYE